MKGLAFFLILLCNCTFWFSICVLVNLFSVDELRKLLSDADAYRNFLLSLEAVKTQSKVSSIIICFFLLCVSCCSVFLAIPCSLWLLSISDGSDTFSFSQIRYFAPPNYTYIKLNEKSSEVLFLVVRNQVLRVRWLNLAVLSVWDFTFMMP